MFYLPTALVPCLYSLKRWRLPHSLCVRGVITPGGTNVPAVPGTLPRGT